MCEIRLDGGLPPDQVALITTLGHRPKSAAYRNHKLKALPSGFDVEQTLTQIYRALKGDIMGLVEQVKSGAIDPQQFADDAYLLIEDAHSKAWYLGRKRSGMTDAFNSADQQAGRVAADFDSFFIANWRDDFVSGRYFDGEEWADGLLKERARAYGTRVRGTANEAFVLGTEEQGLEVEFTWDRSAAESCQDCIEYESLNPWLPGELPSFPGDCSTDCRHNCQCRIVRSDGKLGFDPFDD
jgi:hypothetical protein